jgi:hypothetical protein
MDWSENPMEVSELSVELTNCEELKLVPVLLDKSN